MTEYFIFLRGINVGGHHKVPMAKLREILEGAGCENIRTVLNSGNVVLEATEKKQDKLEDALEAVLESAFGFAVPVMARDAGRMNSLLHKEPFSDSPDHMQAKWMVTFLKKPVGRHEDLESDGLELVFRAPDLVCWVLDLEIKGTPDAMKVMEGWYGRETTTRTWQTLEKLSRK